MPAKYSDEITELLVKTVLAFCNEISQVNYCKAYKIGFREEVTIDLYNNVLYKIGSGKFIYPSLKEDEILVAVVTRKGTEGMVFSLNGIYYRASSMLSDSIFVEYEKCNSISAFRGLNEDEKFSKKELNDMFNTFKKIFEYSRLNVEIEKKNLRDKISSKGDYSYFEEDKEKIDAISDVICSFWDAEYYKKERALPFWKIAEKRKIRKEAELHRLKMDGMIERRNKSGNIDAKKRGLIEEIIIFALKEGYFLSEDFDRKNICMNRNYIKNEVLELFKDDNVYKEHTTYTDDDEFIAFIDLSNGEYKEGIVFLCERIWIKQGNRIRERYYKLQHCYYEFYSTEIEGLFNPYKLNHVLDKIHKITEEK